MAVTSSVDAGPVPSDTHSPGAPSGAADERVPEPTGVFSEMSRVAASARETFASFLELVTLEAQRAGVALVWMVAGGIGAALLGVTGWLALVAALAMWLVALGMPPIGAMLAIAVASAAAAGGLVYWCMTMSRALLFSATRRQLAGKPRAP
jgi:hypothetical protein